MNIRNRFPFHSLLALFLAALLGTAPAAAQDPEPQEAAGSGEGSQQLRRRRQQQEDGPPPQGNSPQGSPLSEGSPSPQCSPAMWQGSPPPLPQDLPLPLASTALWFVVSAWLLWQLMEATLL